MTVIFDKSTGKSVKAFQLSENIHGYAQFWTEDDQILWAEEDFASGNFFF